MRNLKILPKIFLQIFIIINILIIVIHLSVYLIFPKSYLETRKHEVDIKADEIALSMNGKDLKFVMQALEFYSNNSEIKAYIKGIKSEDEIGHLKKQLNMLYETLLGLIDDLEEKNEEITRLSKLRYDFFRGRSHELKTPLASLKIVLENMKYNIGKYKDKDFYIGECINMVDELNHSISQTLSISSYDQLRNDEEILVLKDMIYDVEKKYLAQIEKKNLHLDIKLGDEKLYIGRTALKIVLSNLMSNATKYNVNDGKINIGVKDGWLYVENTGENLGELNLDRIFEIGFSLDKENGNGIGLYVVSNILINYGIEHKIEMNGDRFIFLIKLNA